MWDRKQLKSRAKSSFKRNYWKCILISIIFALFVGGAPAAASAWGSGGGSANRPDVTGRNTFEVSDIDEDDLEHFDDDEWLAIRDRLQRLNMSNAGMAAYLITFFMLLTTAFVIIMAIVIVLDVFVCNPLEVGCSRFYFKNLNELAQVKEVAFGFDHNYKNVVKTMFFRDLYTFLWSLLFIIPGIVKGYEYQMIPYLLADNPQMTKEEAFAQSRRMMSGQKWRAFVLDLSFLGWRILSVFTFGILNIFYVQPYVDAAHAALYEALRYNVPNQNTGNIQ